MALYVCIELNNVTKEYIGPYDGDKDTVVRKAVAEIERNKTVETYDGKTIFTSHIVSLYATPRRSSAS